jgi:Domain of unknown function (DUF4184)
MPFTPAHAAAAFPFRSTRLVWSALLIGTMAPDFEYFLHFAPEGRHGHTMPGIVILTLPLALVTLWLFHKFVKGTFVELMPECLRSRLMPLAGEFRFGGPTRFTLILASILVGVTTHLVWDSFTHPNGWSVLHWRTLQRQVRLPFVGGAPLYKLLQHGSTILGLSFLMIWLMAWYGSAEANLLPVARPKSAWPARSIVTLALIMVIAAMGAVAISLVTTGAPQNLRGIPHFSVPVVVAAASLTWWELVLLGILQSRRKGNEKLC